MFDFLRVRSKKDLPPFKDLGKFQQRTRVIAVVLQTQIVSSSFIFYVRNAIVNIGLTLLLTNMARRKVEFNHFKKTNKAQ